MIYRKLCMLFLILFIFLPMPVYSQIPDAPQTPYIAYFSTQGADKPGLLGDLVLFDPSNMQVVDTFSVDAETSSLEWSPDGSQLAITIFHDGAHRLALLDRDTLIFRTLDTRYLPNNVQESITIDSEFVWFQNNQRILFSQFEINEEIPTSTIMLIDILDGAPHRLIPDILVAYAPSLSYNDDMFIFVGYPFEINSRENSIPNRDLYMMVLNTGEIERLTNTPESESIPSWSSDGTKIVYVLDTQLTLLNMIDRDITELSIVNAVQPKWIKNDTHIMYIATEGGLGYLRLVELATNEVETITSNDFIGPYTLSPDRTQVAYLTRRHNETWQLCGYDLQSNESWCATEIPEPYSATRLAWG